jgi:hypothetical protein
MKKLGAIILLVAIAISATVSTGEAGWKKRGWYMKKQGTVCVMRKVTVVTGNGKTVVREIRVCG